ncbi:hepatic lectin-like [Takifugu rubripes]|uniref:hepatic lectin-like n=1 Tax=Takifugu rubripes TaxID=31033 RepID=UPI00114566CE|nr:hepatic lectin-like [Takifugu rubripes]
MTDTNTVYSDVTFVKTRKGTRETTSTPDETTYSEVKVSKIKAPSEPDGPQQAVSNGGSKVTSVAFGLLTALLTAAVIGLIFTTLSYFQTMARLHQLSAQNANLTETCSQITSPTEEPKTCPAFVNTTNPCLNCPDGWKGFEGQCYYFSNNTLDFEKAREQCQQQGADLVKVSSKEEQKFLAAAVAPMITNNDRFWIGLTDSEKEGQWLWMDRSPLEESLKFWVSHEPDDWKKEDPENGEDCATLGERSGKAYCWYDRTCKYPLRSICEKPGMPGYLMCAGI